MPQLVRAKLAMCAGHRRNCTACSPYNTTAGCILLAQTRLRVDRSWYSNALFLTLSSAQTGHIVPDTMHTLAEGGFRQAETRASRYVKQKLTGLDTRVHQAVGRAHRSGKVRSGHVWASSGLDRSATGAPGQLWSGLLSRLASSHLVCNRVRCLLLWPCLLPASARASHGYCLARM